MKSLKGEKRRAPGGKKAWSSDFELKKTLALPEGADCSSWKQRTMAGAQTVRSAELGSSPDAPSLPHH